MPSSSSKSRSPLILFAHNEYIHFFKSLLEKVTDQFELKTIISPVQNSETVHKLAKALNVKHSTDLRASIARFDSAHQTLKNQSSTKQNQPFLLIAANQMQSSSYPSFEGIELALRQGWHVLFLEPLLEERHIWIPEAASSIREANWAPLGYQVESPVFDELRDWLNGAAPLNKATLTYRIHRAETTCAPASGHPNSYEACLFEALYTLVPYVDLPEQILASSSKNTAMIDAAVGFNFGSFTVSFDFEVIYDLPEQSFFSLYLRGQNAEKRLLQQNESWLSRCERQMRLASKQGQNPRAATYCRKAAALYQAMKLSLQTGLPEYTAKFMHQHPQN